LGLRNAKKPDSIGYLRITNRMRRP
jgi:hypothetical protein